MTTPAVDYSLIALSHCIAAHRIADAAFIHSEREVQDIVMQNREYIIKSAETPAKSFNKACMQTSCRAASTPLKNGDVVVGRLGEFFMLFRSGRMLGLAKAADYAREETKWFAVTEFSVLKSEQVA